MSENLADTVRQINEADYFINSLIYQEFQAFLDDEITPKQAILLDLIKQSTQLTISEMANKMKISSSAVSQLVSKMEKQGYLKRRINPANRREILVTLRDKSHKYFAKHDQVEQMIAERLYAKLEAAELEHFKKIILKLKQIAIQEFNSDLTE